MDHTVIEASRGIKKSGGSEEVVVIPTMSTQAAVTFSNGQDRRLTLRDTIPVDITIERQEQGLSFDNLL